MLFSCFHKLNFVFVFKSTTQIAAPTDEKKKLAKEGKKARFDPSQQLTVSQLQV